MKTHTWKFKPAILCTESHDFNLLYEKHFNELNYKKKLANSGLLTKWGLYFIANFNVEFSWLTEQKITAGDAALY